MVTDLLNPDFQEASIVDGRALPPLINIQDASFMVGGKVLLDGISLCSSARRIAVVGRNGSGKTTLARLIAGLIPPNRGAVRVAGVDVAGDRTAALRAVGILFQNPDHQIIFPTVAEELGFGLRQMGLDAEAVRQGVDAILSRFDKLHWRDAPISQMSQGQRQLVCLMSVLAMAPRVILLDEPFAGLDMPTAIHLERLLADIDATLVQITHDPSGVSGYDHVVWIEAGRIVHQGHPAVVLDAFRRAMVDLGASDDFADLAG